MDNIVNKYKFVLSILICFISVVPLTIIVTKANGSGCVTLLSQTELPKELQLSINTECSVKHSYFSQATANDNGWYAVYYRNSFPRDEKNDFRHVYVHIYSASGDLLREISFVSPNEITIELTTDQLYIYFYNRAVAINLVDWETSAYIVEDSIALTGEVSKELKKDIFTKGKWTYFCEKNIDGYIKLTRSDKVTEQVLIEVDNAYENYYIIMLPGILVSLLGFIFLGKKRRNNQGSVL